VRLEDQVEGEDMCIGLTLQELSMKTGVSMDNNLGTSNSDGLLSDDEDLPL